MQGRRKVKGWLRGIEGDAVRVETAAGIETVPFADIGRARLVPRIDWRKGS
jgi:ribosome maturation factor RimP